MRFFPAFKHPFFQSSHEKQKIQIPPFPAPTKKNGDKNENDVAEKNINANGDGEKDGEKMNNRTWLEVEQGSIRRAPGMMEVEQPGCNSIGDSILLRTGGENVKKNGSGDGEKKEDGDAQKKNDGDEKKKYGVEKKNLINGGELQKSVPLPWIEKVSGMEVEKKAVLQRKELSAMDVEEDSPRSERGPRTVVISLAFFFCLVFIGVLWHYLGILLTICSPFVPFLGVVAVKKSAGKLLLAPPTLKKKEKCSM